MAKKADPTKKSAPAKPAGTSAPQAKPGGTPKRAPPPRPAKWIQKPTYDVKSPEITNNFQEKVVRSVELYEKAVWKNRDTVIEIEDELAKLREDIAERLVIHAEHYYNETRKDIQEVNLVEKEAQDNLLKARMAMKENYRIWRVALLKSIAKESVRQAVVATKEYSKLVAFDSSQSVSDVSKTSLSGLLVDKDNIVKTKNKLGEGAFGRVFKGIVHGNVVAVKELINAPFGDGKSMHSSSAIQSFRAEVELLSQIKHPRILQFMGACIHYEKDESYYALLTEVAENGSLNDILYNTRKGAAPVKLSFNRKMVIIGEIVDGMRHLHGNKPQIVHLDLKGANILMDEDFHVKIADFGMSRVNDASVLTAALGTFVGGTPYYMAPEIIGAEFGKHVPSDQTAKADVYSFAILVNELICEMRPYQDIPDANTFDRLKIRVCAEEAIKGKSRPNMLEGVPKDIEKLITDCWSPKPTDRPSFAKLYADKAWESAANSLVNKGENRAKKIMSEFKEDDKAIPYMVFMKKVRDVYHLENELNEGQPMSLALKAIMEVANAANAVVTKDQVARFLGWFADVPQNDFNKAIYVLCCYEWFFGFLDEITAVNILSQSENKKQGTYLVRWEKSSNCWFVSYITKEEKDKKKELMIRHAVVSGKNVGEVVTVKQLTEWLSEFKTAQKLQTHAFGRPSELKAVAIREKYVTGGKEGLYSTAGAASTGADLSSHNSIAAHFNFVL